MKRLLIFVPLILLNAYLLGQSKQELELSMSVFSQDLNEVLSSFWTDSIEVVYIGCPNTESYFASSEFDKTLSFFESVSITTTTCMTGFSSFHLWVLSSESHMSERLFKTRKYLNYKCSRRTNRILRRFIQKNDFDLIGIGMPDDLELYKLAILELLEENYKAQPDSIVREFNKIDSTIRNIDLTHQSGLDSLIKILGLFNRNTLDRDAANAIGIIRDDLEFQHKLYQQFLIHGSNGAQALLLEMYKARIDVFTNKNSPLVVLADGFYMINKMYSTLIIDSIQKNNSDSSNHTLTFIITNKKNLSRQPFRKLIDVTLCLDLIDQNNDRSAKYLVVSNPRMKNEGIDFIIIAFKDPF